MPPPLALALCLVFSLVLLRWDARYREGVSAASWIPTLWMLALGSRSVSQWLSLGAPGQNVADMMMEGSPVDAAFFFALIVLAVAVLVRRRVKWGPLLRQNAWFVVFMLYCLVSVCWSDYAFVSSKRWFKALGDPLMVLVLLTEQRPSAAIIAVLRRIAFFLIPLSVVFIKYFPALGRTYDQWTGQAYYSGVAGNKNLLGYLLFICGLLFACTLAERGRWADEIRKRGEVVISLLFLGMIWWLFQVANTKTPLLALLVAASIALSVGARSVRRHLGALTLAAVVLAVIGQSLADLFGGTLSAVGRDTTLTGRTVLWSSLFAMANNPLFGAGFESFWLGPRLLSLWREFDWGPTQAHNGYLEIYLNLGAVGLALFTVFVITSFLKIRTALTNAFASDSASADDVVFARYAPAYAFAMLLYNVTEATFKPLNLIFITYLLCAFSCAGRPPSDLERAADTSKSRQRSAGLGWTRRAGCAGD
jgi:O-antigen ligase